MELLGLGALGAMSLLSIPILFLLSAFLLMLSCNIVGVEVPNFGWALVVSLVAAVVSIVVGFPLNCTIGCTVGLVSAWIGWAAQIAVAVGLSSAVYSSMLDIDAGKAFGVALTHTGLSMALWLPMYFGLWAMGFTG